VPRHRKSSRLLTLPPGIRKNGLSGVLKEHELGAPTGELCRKRGISQQTSPTMWPHTFCSPRPTGRILHVEYYAWGNDAVEAVGNLETLGNVRREEFIVTAVESPHGGFL